MKKINIWNFWVREWGNASKFFHSKGNADTKNKLKNKWYEDFKKMLMEVEEIIKDNFRTSHDSSFIRDCSECRFYPDECKNYAHRKLHICSKFEIELNVCNFI